MDWIIQIAFAVMFAAAVILFSKNIGRIKKVILLGKDDGYVVDKQQGWKQVFLLALGQKKMFKNVPVAVMHFIIYAGFIIINIEVLEIILDGLLGTHRLFAAPLGGLYDLLINSFEWLALGVLLVCVAFLVRRNIMHIQRLRSKDLNGWPRSDANYILIAEIILMSLFLLMNASEQVLIARQVGEYASHSVGPFQVSGLVAPLLEGLSSQSLVFVERASWWIHIAGILAFLNYLPYSKHLHILFAFPNAYYSRTNNYGHMQNMPAIQKEVVLAMGGDIQANATLAALPDAPPDHFGAKDITDLSWKNLLDAYSCTECGRCSAACPANSTGKMLSPRTIMMKTRDRADEVSRKIKGSKSWEGDEKMLLHDYITEEELRACTTCNACVEACPVSINPLDIIVQLRRHLILDESKSPTAWNSMFSNIENNFAPWKFAPDEREAWMEK